MSRYIKKNRETFKWVALPLFCIMLLGAVGISIFPEWVKPVYGQVGEPCRESVSFETCEELDQDTIDLLLACNPCEGLICDQPEEFSDGQCVATDEPACPGNCRQCTDVELVTGVAFSEQSGLQDVCTPRANCELDTSLDANCTLCEEQPPPAPFNNCGNGICEPSLGEDCASCDTDCLLPGFEDCPLTSGPVIAAACIPPNLVAITFDGPPYNIQQSEECEDGDLCTNNACNTEGQEPTCDATPKSCIGDLADFCCPAGCEPPPDGPGSCPDLLGSNCDADCYVPQECLVPSPSPSPPPPITGLCLSGSSLISGDGNAAPACDCSLNPDAPMAPGKTSVMGLMALVVAAFVISLRRKARP